MRFPYQQTFWLPSFIFPFFSFLTSKFVLFYVLCDYNILSCLEQNEWNYLKQSILFEEAWIKMEPYTPPNTTQKKTWIIENKYTK